MSGAMRRICITHCSRRANVKTRSLVVSKICSSSSTSSYLPSAPVPSSVTPFLASLLSQLNAEEPNSYKFTLDSEDIAAMCSKENEENVERKADIHKFVFFS
jgi:hypothetical protein